MLQVNDPHLAKRNLQIVKGYIAFNNCNRAALADVFCDDIEDAEGNVTYPRWHLMDSPTTPHGAEITGKENILDYLLNDLADAGARADLLGVGTQGKTAITLDFTTGIPGEPAHVCGDRIDFDDDDRIKEVWHCEAATHLHAHSERHHTTS